MSSQLGRDYIVESKIDTEGHWYKKYSSGIIEQGGVITSYAGSAYSSDYIYKFKFPFSFPNEVLGIQITNYKGYDYYNDVIYTYNTDGFELYYDSSAGSAITKYYYAVGK